MAQEASVNTRLSQICSLLVIVSYFLVWSKTWISSTTGFSLLSDVFKGMKDIKGDNALITFGLILFIASPIVCHVLNLLNAMISNANKSSRMLTSIPAATWVAAVLLILAKSKGDATMLKILFPHDVGAIIAIIGISGSFIFSLLSSTSNTTEQIIEKSDPAR